MIIFLINSKNTTRKMKPSVVLPKESKGPSGSLSVSSRQLAVSTKAKLKLQTAN